MQMDGTLKISRRTWHREAPYSTLTALRIRTITDLLQLFTKMGDRPVFVMAGAVLLVGCSQEPAGASPDVGSTSNNGASSLSDCRLESATVGPSDIDGCGTLEQNIKQGYWLYPENVDCRPHPEMMGVTHCAECDDDEDCPGDGRCEDGSRLCRIGSDGRYPCEKDEQCAYFAGSQGKDLFFTPENVVCRQAPEGLNGRWCSECHTDEECPADKVCFSHVGCLDPDDLPTDNGS